MTPLAPSTHGHLGWRVAQGSGLVHQISVVALASQDVERVAQDIFTGSFKGGRRLFIARKMSRRGYWTVRFSLMNNHACDLLRPLFFKATSMQSNFAR